MTSFIKERDNNALKINPPNADRHLTTAGSDWLWAVMTIFGLVFFAWLMWTLFRGVKPQKENHSVQKQEHNNTSKINRGSFQMSPSGRWVFNQTERVFHYLWTFAAFVGFITYFTMASDLGNTPVRQYMHHGTNYQQTRQIFYVRYIYWFIAWPLVVIANLLVSGVSWATIIFAVALQEFWVVSWLSGALVRTNYKWGFYTFGLLAYVILAYILLSWGNGHARRIQTTKHYTKLSGLLVIVWAIYPIAWGICEGSNTLSVTGEMVFYGILDFITIPVYGTLFLLSTRQLGSTIVPFTQTGRIQEVRQTIVPEGPALARPVQNQV